jgi:hypothetical protein
MAGRNELVRALEGDDAHYRALIRYIEQHPAITPADYDHVQTMMDVDNFIDYQVAQIFFVNTDWPGNNA